MAQVEINFHPQDFLDDYENRLSEALVNIGLAIEAEAKPIAPFDTGALRSSIETRKIGQGEVMVFVGVEYGIFQENRNSYLKEAFDNVLSNSAESIIEAMFT